MAPTANAAAKEELEMRDLAATFWQTSRPSLSRAEYLALLEPVYDQYWSQEDEKRLDKERREDDWQKRLLTNVKFVGQGGQTTALALWRVFPRLYKSLPTDLFSYENKIRFQTDPAGILWTKRVYDPFMAFILNGFWTWDAELDFPLMTQLIQLAVRSRQNDCRQWGFRNHTSDSYIDELVLELERDNSAAGDNSTIVQVMDRVDHIMAARHMWRRRPGQVQSLFRAVVDECFSATTPKKLGQYEDGEYYTVGLRDIEKLNTVLETFNESASRTGLRERIPSKTWKRVMNQARGASQREELPHENSDMAKVISIASMKWKRDEMRAQRVQDGYVQPAEAQPVQAGRQVWKHGPFPVSTKFKKAGKKSAKGKAKGKKKDKGKGKKKGKQPASGRGRNQDTSESESSAEPTEESDSSTDSDDSESTESEEAGASNPGGSDNNSRPAPSPRKRLRLQAPESSFESDTPQAKRRNTGERSGGSRSSDSEDATVVDAPGEEDGEPQSPKLEPLGDDEVGARLETEHEDVAIKEETKEEIETEIKQEEEAEEDIEEVVLRPTIRRGSSESW